MALINPQSEFRNPQWRKPDAENGLGDFVRSHLWLGRFHGALDATGSRSVPWVLSAREQNSDQQSALGGQLKDCGKS